MTDHIVTYRLLRRAFLDTLKTPTCTICGDLTDEPIDAEPARVAARRHEMAAGRGEL